MNYEEEIDTRYWLTGVKGEGPDCSWSCVVCDESEPWKESCRSWFVCAGPTELFEIPDAKAGSSEVV